MLTQARQDPTHGRRTEFGCLAAGILALPLTVHLISENLRDTTGIASHKWATMRNAVEVEGYSKASVLAPQLDQPRLQMTGVHACLPPSSMVSAHEM